MKSLCANNFETCFDSSIAGLTPNIRRVLLKLPSETKASVNEIRLRINKPIILQQGGNVVFITEDGRECKKMDKFRLLTTSHNDILNSFHNICSYSIYSKQNEIKNGFVTIKGGHRVGVCGTAVIHENRMTGLRNISSLNIRVARELPGIANELLNKLNNDPGKVLLAGPPACGKTTMLRDIARQVSFTKKVCVLDERGEIGATVGGIAQNDLGLCDILTGYPKGVGILQAIRCLSPDVIICDEIGSQEEIYAIEEGLNAGVSVVASIHCFSIEDLKRRIQMKKLVSTGAFNKVVLMTNAKTPGEIRGIYGIGDIVA